MVSVPAAVVAATGGFLLGVATFVLVRVLRRPRARPAHGASAAGAAARGGGGGLALVPRRRPPAQGPVAATRRAATSTPAGAATGCPGRPRRGARPPRAALARLLHVGEEQVAGPRLGSRRRVRMRAEARSTGRRRRGASSACASRSAPITTCPSSTRRFRRDPLIGPVIRTQPWLRPRRRPEPFEALVWAICEQLIESGRAARDPAPARAAPRTPQRLRHAATRRPRRRCLAGRSPAELEACGLAAKRAIA